VSGGITWSSVPTTVQLGLRKRLGVSLGSAGVADDVEHGRRIGHVQL
jgi:hypothetical protein